MSSFVPPDDAVCMCGHRYAQHADDDESQMIPCGECMCLTFYERRPPPPVPTLLIKTLPDAPYDEKFEELLAIGGGDRTARVLRALIFATRELLPEGALIETMRVEIRDTQGKQIVLGPIQRIP